MKRIVDTSKTMKRIIDTSKTMRRIDPDEVAKLLGAEKMTPEEVIEFKKKNPTVLD